MERLALDHFPAGRAGSAMLLADDGKQHLLYTGDFKLSPSARRIPECPHAPFWWENTFGGPEVFVCRRAKSDYRIGELRTAVAFGG